MRGRGGGRIRDTREPPMSERESAIASAHEPERDGAIEREQALDVWVGFCGLRVVFLYGSR